MRSASEILEEVLGICATTDIQGLRVAELEERGESGYLVFIELPSHLDPADLQVSGLVREISAIPEVGSVFIQLAARE